MQNSTLQNPPERLAYSVSEFCGMAGISASAFYREVRAGRIIVRKMGRKSVVTQTDAQTWLASLPVVSHKREAA